MNLHRPTPRLTDFTLRLLQLLLLAFLHQALQADTALWKPVAGHIQTRWAKDVNPARTLPEYPRPQLTRDAWINLNGLWDYSIHPTNQPAPARYDGLILVPFPVESSLSGVARMVGPTNRLEYHRAFTIPVNWKGQRILLHFGAVDWEANVAVNGRVVGSHQGGYDPFTVDITDALQATGLQHLAVSVWDPSDAGPQPRGKQVSKPGGIWYTPTTGIWQTPWLEPVPANHIEGLRITPDLDSASVSVEGQILGATTPQSLKVEILSQGKPVQQGTVHFDPSSASAPAQWRGTVKLKVPNPRPWSPDSPHLYDLRVTLIANGKRRDQVGSYFGLRKSSLARDASGVLRMQLNNQPLFQVGPLDQGFWPDGLYTAPTDEALRSDIEMTRKLGFNLARKHVKVEPDRWYYWCDKLGLLVWQDMPSGDRSAPWKGPSGIDGKEMIRTPESAAIYERELKAIIDSRYNHPSIVTWVPFNEGWGQFDTARILNWVMQYDPTRLVDGASGGNHVPAGHILDHHQYPGPGAPEEVRDRARVLGEFGGLGLPIPGHTWQEEKNWGYRSFKTVEEVTQAYLDLIIRLKPMVEAKGLSAAIYTQTTDVEVEINGLMTYDREIVKLAPDKIAAANRELHHLVKANPAPPSAAPPAVENASQSAARFSGAVVTAQSKASAAVRVPTAPRSGLYTQNRAPLLPAPFMKLPIGSIQPKGWLRHQLELEASGMTGHLEELSPWLDFSKSSWSSKDGSGKFGWEEMPYWLKGFGDLGYVLGDERIQTQTRKWIDAILQTQREDGYYGPRMLLTSLEGKPDLWPHMLVNNILQSYHERTGDGRVIPFLLNYHRWLHQQPATTFTHGYWPHIRWGDNIETCHWLYNRTGEPFLLELAERIHRNMAAWRDGVINWHNVNLAQGFREPGVFFTQSAAERDLAQAEANYLEITGRYGQFPGGGFAGDENCRPGHTDPRQGFETCGMVEFTHSFEMLTRISGDVRWADRAEEIAFNSLPAALTPDWKGLHYLTCANQVQLDRETKAPVLENGGTMVSYSPFEVYRCCQHNVSHGWPYYAEELWLATADHGLAASLYAASQVTAKVGDGTRVTWTESTDYPFDDTISLKLSTQKSVEFPLHLRIPRWATGSTLTMNGRKQEVAVAPGTFAILKRQWRNGDIVTLKLPMPLRVRTWDQNRNAVSIDRGPLTYSLKIKERWASHGSRHPQWPEWEVFPESPWNYGLVLDPAHPERTVSVHRRSGPLAANPFTHEGSPIELQAKARRIPTWTMDALHLVGSLPASPVTTTEPEETVTLIPMGAARLRITSFPTATSPATP